MAELQWERHNPAGRLRVVVTRRLPGETWLRVLAEADACVDVCCADGTRSAEQIRAAFGPRCDGCIGQLTESWDENLLRAFKAAGGKVYSNYAVGYDNVDVASATGFGIAVGNTPAVLTQATAETAVALTLAAARRIVEADAFMRKGLFQGWSPDLFLGELLSGATVGIVGAGRIGAAYGRIMAEGFKANLLYYDPSENRALERYLAAYGDFLAGRGERSLSCRRVAALESLLEEADIVSLHCVLTEGTRHMIDARRLSSMKETAILINTSRGPLIDEKALVEHCLRHPRFRVGLDVYENEPAMSPGLAELPNVVLLPHIGSATWWTRQAMAIIAARNVAGILRGYPVWRGDDVSVFLGEDAPHAVPSVVNALELGLPMVRPVESPG
jgi:hydroxypyruvate reductase 1